MHTTACHHQETLQRGRLPLLPELNKITSYTYTLEI